MVRITVGVIVRIRIKDTLTNTADSLIGLNIVCNKICYKSRRDGVVVRASALQSVDLWFIPLVESHQKT